MINTYKVSEIETILKLSRTKTYALVNQGLFPIIRVGKALRIPAGPFEDWLRSIYNYKDQPDLDGDDVKDKKNN